MEGDILLPSGKGIQSERHVPNIHVLNLDSSVKLNIIPATHRLPAGVSPQTYLGKLVGPDCDAVQRQIRHARTSLGRHLYDAKTWAPSYREC